MIRKHSATTRAIAGDNVVRNLFENDRYDTAITLQPRKVLKNKVLIIDESELFRHLTKVVLSQHGYNITEAKSADEGLSIMLDECPDLILLDATTPGCHAFDTLDLIQASGTGTNTPVIILTSEDLFTTHQTDGLYAADDYLFKPISPSQLAGKVDQHIEPITSEKH